MEKEEIREKLEKFYSEMPANPIIYDFKTRFGLAQGRWEEIFKKLRSKGCDKEKTSFKIVSSGEALKITFSPEITKLLHKFREKAEEISAYDHIKPKSFEIVKNSIVTTGKNGLSQTSILLNLVCSYIKGRIHGRRFRFKKERKELRENIKKYYNRTGCCKSIAIEISPNLKNILEDRFSVVISLEFHPPKPSMFPDTLKLSDKTAQQILKEVEKSTDHYLKMIKK